MNPILQKLNAKPGMTALVENVPTDLQPLVEDLKTVATVYDETLGSDPVTWALAFVTKQSEIDALVPLMAEKAPGDAALWFAYPKGTSKKYRCDFNRDTGWATLGRFGFEGVRQVAIDDDWSALRFRRVEFVKSMKRNETRAMTEAGKQRAGKAE
jgi:hypothetical protein